MSDYREKLKDPRWQKKRLTILDRDAFTCRQCGATTKTLHVHHLDYIHGRAPWEYPDGALVTLCEACHEIEHETQQDARATLLDSLISRGATSQDLYSLAVAIDLSGSNDQQITGAEWQAIASVVKHVLGFRHAGGDLESMRGLIQELCAKEGEE